MKYAKFWVALIGGTATSVIAVFGADTTVGKVATIVAAACTAAGVYMVPNAPAEPPKPDFIRESRAPGGPVFAGQPYVVGDGAPVEPPKP